MQNETSRGVLNWLLLVLGAVIGASILTPPTVQLIDSLSLLEGLREYSAPKVYRRWVMALFLLGAFFFRRYLYIPPAGQIGLVRHSRWRRNLLTGLVVGIVSLAALQLVAFAFGHRVIERDENLTLGYISAAILGGFATAAAVGILEEILFRGALFHAFLRRNKPFSALLLTGIIFSGVHFFRAGDIPIDRHSWLVGPVSAQHLLYGWWEQFHLFPDFVGLFLVSSALCVSVLITKDLFTAIGLHAGWVFVIQFAKDLFDKVRNVPEEIFGGSQFYDGIVGLVMLVLVIPFLYLCFRFGLLKKAESFDRRSESDLP